jgi:SAM-dependent methyltransferase
LRLGISPTESDRQTVSLPRLLTPLYLVVRPWRLLREYGLGLKRRLKPDLAIYESTPHEIVNHMLRLAEISPGDVLYDLGCGDGRIVVTAAEKYGIRGVGVDINPRRISEARANARGHRVGDLVEFHHGDAKKFDFANATIVTLFLGADANLRLVERLRAELNPGARVVSRDFIIPGWNPDRSETCTIPNTIPSVLYLWTIKNPERETSVTASATHGDLQSDKAKE